MLVRHDDPTTVSSASASPGTVPAAAREPAVTIVMAARDAAATIAAAIASCLSQTFTDFELLVIDDASQDDTARIAASFDDPRVRVIRLERNVGAGAARNHGLRAARGALVAILDADDLSYPARLERQVSYLATHPGCGLLGAAFDRLDPEGRVVGTAQPPTDDAVLRFRLLTGNVIVHSSVVMRRDLALAAGGYPEDLRNGQDYALWVALMASTGLAQLPDVLIGYRDNPRGLTATRTGEHRRTIVETSRAALSAACGRPVSPAAVACLWGVRPTAGRRAACLEAARALADALPRVLAEPAAPAGTAGALLADWRRQATCLCAIAPTAWPGIVRLGLGLTVTSVGARDVGPCLAWSGGSLRVAARTALADAVRPLRRRPRAAAAVEPSPAPSAEAETTPFDT
jgi:hypothetical protein